MAAYDTIVGHVGLGHEQIVAANARYSTALDRSPAHCHALAKYVAITDIETGSLTSVL
jgi:hypothetical protein